MWSVFVFGINLVIQRAYSEIIGKLGIIIIENSCIYVILHIYEIMESQPVKK